MDDQEALELMRKGKTVYAIGEWHVEEKGSDKIHVIPSDVIHRLRVDKKIQVWFTTAQRWIADVV